MRKVKTTTVALSTVAALLATGGAAAAVATSDADLSSTVSQTSPAEDASAADTSAADGAATAKHGPKGDGARKLCKRAPKIDKKIDRVLRRLDGDATKRGSVERLEKRIDNAKKAGHGTIANFLNERLEDRRDLKPRLKDRQKDLAKVRAWCADQREKKTGKKSESSGT
ncbi:MAG TPA: hypothetical protein VGO89_22415 [Streptomyces sp.]|jgi:hypothetical protein|nr:hypothetical protein [Streptomyces sp.]